MNYPDGEFRARVLVIGMLNSIHLARWLENFSDSQIVFDLFPSTADRGVHPRIRKLISQAGKNSAVFNMPKVGRLSASILARVKILTGIELRSRLLGLLINMHDYRVVHIVEMQNAGYLYLDSCRHLKTEKAYRLIISPWGSDVNWFMKYERHVPKISRLLEMADVFAAECSRDIKLARELGFRGKVLDPIPFAGGLERFLKPEEGLGSQRNIITIKGYQGWSGQALEAVKAIRENLEYFVGKKVVLFSCDKSVMRAARKLRGKISIQAFPKGSLSHDEMLSLFSKTLVYVGVSRTDGLPASLLEAMSMGAVPVQSDTSCCEDWIRDGETGIILRENTPLEIGKAIQIAMKLADEPSVKHQIYNEISGKLNRLSIKDQLKNFYLF